MAGESVEQLLRLLTAQTGDDSAQVYAKWAALTTPTDGETLEQLVRFKLTANAKTAQLRESLLETIHAGGGVGESLEECLLASGLTGWS